MDAVNQYIYSIRSSPRPPRYYVLRNGQCECVCVYIQVYAYYKDLYVVQQQRSAYARGGFYNIII